MFELELRELADLRLRVGLVQDDQRGEFGVALRLVTILRVVAGEQGTGLPVAGAGGFDGLEQCEGVGAVAGVERRFGGELGDEDLGGRCGWKIGQDRTEAGEGLGEFAGVGEGYIGVEGLSLLGSQLGERVFRAAHAFAGLGKSGSRAKCECEK